MKPNIFYISKIDGHLKSNIIGYQTENALVVESFKFVVSLKHPTVTS